MPKNRGDTKGRDRWGREKEEILKRCPCPGCNHNDPRKCKCKNCTFTVADDVFWASMTAVQKKDNAV